MRNAPLSAALAPRHLPVTLIDVFAGVLDVAAQLPPLIRIHAASISFAGSALFALRHGQLCLALPARLRALILDRRPESHAALERIGQHRLHAAGCYQADTKDSREFHRAAWN